VRICSSLRHKFRADNAKHYSMSEMVREINLILE